MNTMNTQLNTEGTRAAPNGLAVAAMVLGIISLIGSVVFVGGPLGVIGLVLGVLALRRARRTGAGRGPAIAGTVTSSIAIVVSVLVVVSAVWFAHRTQNCYQFHKVQQWQHCVHQQFSAG
ncbi:DUF4190 domain-containing protein [Kitasatospora sp. NBC_01287]|uniref:DUF4190 domain-containing protein n=1 Tax=Kitasatospora sp. NBC_01287 TaxID=2903573 RepID=UPI00224E6809|nr:DUF4190 domain-containing protein [Kitasatospora sp. NBC_01287]MCX4749974.1 DUF4190 domain-containing protein [Kitasatospora sp. NBC_01287]